jgi:hypothetical protein
MPSTPKVLYHNIAGVTSLKSITVTESYNAAMSTAAIDCESTTLNLGDSITFNAGFSGTYGKMFTGYVRKIEQTLPEYRTMIICEDELAKATDYFMASDDPEHPFEKKNILTENLIHDILEQAQITNYAYSVPLSVTWGTGSKGVQFNLTTAYMAARTIADALAWSIYADRNGQVHLADVKPYWTSEGIDFTWTLATGNIIGISHERSTENLRNRVVVYGVTGVQAQASASSAYLPAGFYKTSVIASQIIDNNTLAQQTADLNLTRFNRLTEKLLVEIEGDYLVEPRKFATVTETYTNTSGNWFIYQVESRFDSSGFKQRVVLTK